MAAVKIVQNWLWTCNQGWWLATHDSAYTRDFCSEKMGIFALLECDRLLPGPLPHLTYFLMSWSTYFLLRVDFDVSWSFPPTLLPIYWPSRNHYQHHMVWDPLSGPFFSCIPSHQSRNEIHGASRPCLKPFIYHCQSVTRPSLISISLVIPLLCVFFVTITKL